MTLPLLVPAPGIQRQAQLSHHPRLRHKSAPPQSQAVLQLRTGGATAAMLLPRGTRQYVPRGPSHLPASVLKCRPAGALLPSTTAIRAALASGASTSAATSAGSSRGPAPATSAASAAASEAPVATDPALTVLLFKRDLRVSDHPGLVAASSASSSPLLPLFVLDPAVLRTLPLHLLAPLLASLSALRAALRERGSDLAVRVGRTADVVLQEAKKAGMALKEVLVEEEVESAWKDVIGGLEGALGGKEDVVSPGGASSTPDLTRWRTPLFQSFQVPGTAQYSAFVNSCVGPLAPLEAPQKLPPFPTNVNPGEIPSLEQILELRGKSLHHIPSPSPAAASASSHPLRHEAESLLHDWAHLSHDPVVNHAAWHAVGEGHLSALATLQDYVSGTQPTNTPPNGVPGAQGRTEALRAAVESEESCPFASLLSIFGPALSLGTLSHRQVHAMGLLALGRPLVYPQQPGTSSSTTSTSSSPSWEPPFSVPVPSPLQVLFPDPIKRAPLAAVKHALAVEWHHLLATHSQAGGSLPTQPPSPQNGVTTTSSSSSRNRSSNGSILPLVQPEVFFTSPETGGVPPPPGVSVRHWRWRGMLIEYAVADLTGHSDTARDDATGYSDDKPPVLLVHGFGAFWQHYRGVMLPLAYQGHRVFALTLPGFGRSEKPAAAYSQYFWDHCAADFIADVIGAPAVVAGNSIGGYTVASLAADHPQLAKSVVLFNSAGKIDTAQRLGQAPEGTPVQGGTAGVPPVEGRTGGVSGKELEKQKAALRHSRGFAEGVVKAKRGSGPPRAMVWAFSRALFVYLQSSTGKVVKRCYPNVPGRADGQLVREILRAATDPGAVEVVESVFFLPTPRPLNLLLDVFGGPVLVLQGRNDPLNDAVARANSISSACPQVAVHLLDAGHCPHDEVPEAVSEALIRWAAAPWAGTGVPQRGSRGGANGAASQEEGPLEVLAEEALLGAGVGRKQGSSGK